MIDSLKPPKLSPLIPGYRLGRYELLCPIAEGGMATVWLAHLTGKHGFAKLVAIKTILPKFASDPDFQSMFLDEARIASYIEHANVGHINDLGEENDVLYIVMEWLDGDSLLKVHNHSRKLGFKVPLGVICRILADTCAGLHAAHELSDREGTPLGLVHRDVSPQNILVTTDGVAKLIDFGIAKARNRLSLDTNEGVVKGKIDYMAPEQGLGRPLDRRADVYSIGAILFRFCAKAPPYSAADPVSSLRRLTSGGPPDALPGTVHPAIRAVIERAIARDVDERYATALDLQKALEVAMVEAEIATNTSEVRAFMRERLAARIRARREAVDLALKASEQRAQLLALTKASSPLSSGLIRMESAEEISAAAYPDVPIKQVTSEPKVFVSARELVQTVPRRRSFSTYATTGGLFIALTLIALRLSASVLSPETTPASTASASEAASVTSLARPEVSPPPAPTDVSAPSAAPAEPESPPVLAAAPAPARSEVVKPRHTDRSAKAGPHAAEAAKAGGEADDGF